MEKTIEIFIIEYLSGNLDTEGEKQLERWLEESEENKLEFKKIRDIWLSSELISEKNVAFVDEEWQRFKFKIDSNRRKGRIKRINSFLAAASIILLVLTTIFGLNEWSENKLYRDKLSSEGSNIMEAPYGSKSKLILEDGTKIWLNSGSKLEYPKYFNNKSRDVYLSGEAYFEVAKNKKIPFVVKTSDLDIKVLGTSFNVKSYPEEGTIETTLEEGAVKLIRKNNKAKDEEISLKPEEKAIFIKKEGEIRLTEPEMEEIKNSKIKAKPNHIILAKKVETELYTSWKDQKLIFKKESFENLAIKLERWFDVNIDIEDEELKNVKITGTLENETIEQTLNALKLTTQFNYKIELNNIKITNK